jgi:hypothetical protein
MRGMENRFINCCVDGDTSFVDLPDLWHQSSGADDGEFSRFQVHFEEKFFNGQLQSQSLQLKRSSSIKSGRKSDSKHSVTAQPHHLRMYNNESTSLHNLRGRLNTE